MNYTAFIKKAEALQKQRAALYADKRYTKTLGFFQAKGLLWAKNIKPVGGVKLAIKDVLWVAKNIEPRVFEVLPAALLHCPRSFLVQTHLPEEIKQILQALKLGLAQGPSYIGIPFGKFKFWAEFKTKDGRVRALSEKSVARSFRLLPQAARLLEDRAKAEGISQGVMISKIILDHFAHS